LDIAQRVVLTAIELVSTSKMILAKDDTLKDDIEENVEEIIEKIKFNI